MSEQQAGVQITELSDIQIMTSKAEWEARLAEAQRTLQVLNNEWIRRTEAYKESLKQPAQSEAPAQSDGPYTQLTAVE